MQPSPREVSTKLLTRDALQAGDDPQRARRLLDPDGEPRLVRPRREHARRVHRRPARRGRRLARRRAMKVKRTSPDRTRTWKSGLPPTYVNTVTHWWDASQIYGSTEERNRKLRAGEDGKLIVEDGLLPEEDDPKLGGVDMTGFSDNYWIGLSLLHTLFVKEHNAICDHLKAAHPVWDDEKLFLTARLVNSGADGEDPHGRVDARHPGQPGARAGDELELVRRPAALGPQPLRSRRHRDDRRHRRLPAGPPRRAVLDHRGVRLRLSPAPAAARRLRDARLP